jgi:hypothetical protein
MKKISNFYIVPIFGNDNIGGHLFGMMLFGGEVTMHGLEQTVVGQLCCEQTIFNLLGIVAVQL